LRIWVEAYNAAFERAPDGRDPEGYASRVAWSAVKRAGYRKGPDGRWHRAAGAAFVAEILRHLADEDDETDAVTVSVGDTWDRAVALALPTRGTPSKVYAEFKLLSFGTPNRNKDGFIADDVTDDVVQALVGSPIYLQENATAHPLVQASATARAPFTAGVVTQAEKRDDGVYCVGAFQREVLRDRGIAPEALPEYSVSMEVLFNRAAARYEVGGQILSYEEARAQGVAAAVGQPDDAQRYDVRWIVPLEFHAVALLQRGRNADPDADVFRVAASHIVEGQEGTMSSQVASEQDVHQAGGAELSTEQRKKLPKSAFAYVDEHGVGHLPIHDAAHVRNALARLNQADIPEAAKRKALRRILRAAKRFGVEVDMDSDVVKAYSALAGSAEERLEAVRQAFLDEYPEGYYIIATFDDAVVAQCRDYVAKIPYQMDEDGDVKFGEPIRGRLVFEPERAAAGTVTWTGMSGALPPSEEALRQRIRAECAAELRAAFDREKAEAVERAKAEAVAAYRAREQQVADRMRELEAILPLPAEQRAAWEARVREADEHAFAQLKIERLQAKLAEVEAKAGRTVATASSPPTLRPGQQGTSPLRPYYVTVGQK
jgi:hypothetical protein